MKPLHPDIFLARLWVIFFLTALLLLLYCLSPVLMPFLAAGVVAYLLNPVVNFLQYRCRLRVRVVCVVLTLLLAAGVLVGLVWVCVPPIMEEASHLKDVVRHYMEQGGMSGNSTVPPAVREFFDNHFRDSDLSRRLSTGDTVAVLKEFLPSFWTVFYSTMGVVVSFCASLFSLLYLFFLMLDYDRYAKGWITFVPRRHRAFATRLVDDIGYYVCGYFRGQFGIALSNCVMFSAGFLLIGFPMPVALGCFIGLLSFVPYLQVAGLLPAAVLALLRAAEAGENFWMLLGGVLLVYLVVQILQDVVVTPRIMGHIMRLSPAIVLLALSTGAFVAGIVGLIVALPLTAIVLKYYKLYVVKEPAGEAVE